MKETKKEGDATRFARMGCDERCDVASEMIVKANKSLAMNVDGDLIGEVPVTISILHNHIEFFVES